MTPTRTVWRMLYCTQAPQASSDAWFCLIALLLLAPNSIARVYQWVSPETGTVQLSGEPPSWYRSGESGTARVGSGQCGRLVDDTAIALSVEQNAALREEAFAEVEARRLEALQRLEDEIIREASRRERREAAARFSGKL